MSVMGKRLRQNGLALAILGAMWLTGVAPARADEDLAEGKLLVADARLKDPHFAHTVVLIVTRDERGTLGLVLNRRSDVPISELLARVKNARNRKDTAFSGGPVEPRVILGLLRSRNGPRGARHIAGDIWAIPDQALLEDVLAAHQGSGELRFYFGYAGWGPGQLEAEMESRLMARHSRRRRYRLRRQARLFVGSRRTHHRPDRRPGKSTVTAVNPDAEQATRVVSLTPARKFVYSMHAGGRLMKENSHVSRLKMMWLFPLLVMAGFAAQSNQTKPYLRLESNNLATLRGEVLSNVQGCARDRACYLGLSIDGSGVNVVYLPSEGGGSPVNGEQAKSALGIKAGATIEAHGTYTKSGTLYTLDVYSSKEYWVRVVPAGK